MNWRFNPTVAQSAREILRGGVVAYPTEAVWGLGCDPFNQSAVQKILLLKNRSVEKGLILVAGNIQQIDFLTEGLSSSELNLLNSSWPGHTTWLIPHHGRVPSFVSGKFDSVAVRVSTHPVITALCSLVGGPIVSTSANPQGMRPANSSMSVRRYFMHTGVQFCAGTIGKQSSPSVIKDLSTGLVIRA